MFITVNQNIIENQNQQNTTHDLKKTYLKLQDGEQVYVLSMLPADQFVGYYRHTKQIGGKWEYIHCSDPSTCPLCQQKDRRALRTLIPFIVADDTKGTNARIQIFDASVNDAKELYLAKGECEEDGNVFTDTVFKLKRIGAKLDTTYRFTVTAGKCENFKSKVDWKIPQWDKLIKFPTPEEVIALISGYRQQQVQNIPQQVQPVQPVQPVQQPARNIINAPAVTDTDPFNQFATQIAENSQEIAVSDSDIPF